MVHKGYINDEMKQEVWTLFNLQFFFDNSHMQRFLKKKFRNTCTKGHINIDKSNKVKTIIQIVKLISRNQK